ncbi:MAG: Hsp33 family molecular chaperone HslO [Spirochaetaceae bacterium]|nr:MAG: Hsp33 family molecular chaperone HslO [Spirochaetaceae bacterium]
MTLRAIDDPLIVSTLSALPEDRVDSFVLADGAYRGALLHGTRMINQMRANHELGLIETLLLGHGYLAGGLLSTNVKGNDRISFELSCDGPLGGLSVEATAAGTVRGYLKNNPIPLTDAPTSLDPAQFVGHGTLAVTKLLERAKQPFTGHIRLVYGSLARDLAAYFVYSEQTPTAFHVSIQFDREGRPVGAGGLMIQAMPVLGGYEEREDAIQLIDAAVHEIGSIGRLFADGATPAQILSDHFGALEPHPLATKSVRFHCACGRERFFNFIAALSIEELEDIRRNGPFPLCTTCFNCNTTYSFSAEEIAQAYQLAR